MDSKSFININAELSFSVLVAWGILRAYGKFLNLSVRAPRWAVAANKIWLLGIGVAVFGALFQIESKHLNGVFWLLTFAGTAAMLIRIRDYRPARTILLALAPFALHYLLEFLATVLGNGLVKEYDDAFETAQGFALIWLATFLLIARSQKKNLEAERLVREEEERNKQRIEAQNMELERLVSERTMALTQQAEELRYTLTELKTTQAQLIQAEKMASLGELTAGIAHEIQNPLNFVNNFSEVSAELVQELEEERQKTKRDPELENELLADLKLNLQKITHHGQRASSIVRGMLEHSRASTGERSLTDLNALCDEYLRLAYHGLRAKDKSFNATLETHFDPNLGPVEVISQDIGRVLLNLLTNAFYAVQQRQKRQETGYYPTVTVTTCRSSEGSEIRVRDNGLGIPESVKQKIFQPFFTTKPTGEGTGLGLSLSYDIVTQGHNGTLTVVSEEDQGTEFIITLPT